MVGVTKDGAVVVAIVMLIMIISHQSANSLGKRSFGESCSIGGHITSFFSQDREERACDRDMGLICTGSCTCPPGRVWDFSETDFGFADRSRRGCAGAAGSPCFGSGRNQQCVTNAQCQFAFCRCKPGFKSSGGNCVGSGKNSDDDDDATNQALPPTSSGGISFPELQQIFSGFSSQNNNNYFNNFNNNNNNNEESSGFNDRFNLDNDNDNNYNDRFATNNDNYYNDRFLVNTEDSYHDHHNSRDGSKASSGSIRFE